MSRIKLFILFIVNMLLDLSVLSKFTILGVSPSVTIPLIVVLSMLAKSDKITYYAIFLGLIFDISLNTTIGVRALAYYLISYTVFKRRKYEGLSYFYGLFMVLVGVAGTFLLRTLISLIQMSSIDFSIIISYFKNIYLWEALVNAGIYSLIYLIANYIEDRKSRRYFL